MGEYSDINRSRSCWVGRVRRAQATVDAGDRKFVLRSLMHPERRSDELSDQALIVRRSPLVVVILILWRLVMRGSVLLDVLAELPLLNEPLDLVSER